MIRALGLIEVNGYVVAVEAADAALKAASVTLLGIEKVTGGIVTVKLTGDVGAVKAAVSAGAASADHLGKGIVRTSHVIPRIHEELEKLNLDTRKVEEPVKTTEKVVNIEADSKVQPETVVEVKKEAKAEPNNLPPK